MICCWPLPAIGHQRDVPVGRPLRQRFETSLEQLSGFLAFELAVDGGSASRFVVPVPLLNLPEQRDRLLLRILIGNAERFLYYLLALLDEADGELSLLEAVEGATREAPDAAPDAGSVPVLEKILRTMRRDPRKLAGLHPLISDLAADDALPAGFAEFWETVHDVAAEEAVRQ